MSAKRSLHLALLGSTAVLGLTAVGAAAAGEIASVEWVGSARPGTAAEMAAMFTTARVRTTYADGKVTETPLGYEMLYSTTDRVGDNMTPASALYDENMRAIADPTAPGAVLASETPDGSALLPVAGRLYHLANFEYDWLLADGSSADDTLGIILPSSVVLTVMAQDAATGKLTSISQQPVDLGALGGLSVACNATVTPWGTFLSSSENYDADARRIEADRAAGKPDVLSAFTRLYFGDRRLASPYEQGVLPEISILPGGATKVVKHYAVGRGTYEMGYVMPDQRTVVGGHDGTNQPLTMFVADRPGDLSEGTVYAARLEQVSAENGGTFDLRWVRLGHGNDAELKALVDGGIAFSDIFEVSDEPREGFVETFVGTDKTPEYLKVRNPLAAAFLETMRYAGVMGATTELRKGEGLAFDSEGKRLFFAITDIDNGMTDGKGSGASGDHMQVAKMDAGAVYMLPVADGQTDTDGNPIDSAFVPSAMSVPAGLMGQDLAEADAMGNKADPGRIANPDNLYWSSEYKTLFVGEDSGMHLNNVLWAWQDGMTAPVPLLTAPAGAELTGLRIQENIGGRAYGLTNAQHVGDFKPGDNALLQETMSLIEANWGNRQKAPIGYVTGLPTLTRGGS